MAGLDVSVRFNANTLYTVSLCMAFTLATLTIIQQTSDINNLSCCI